MVARDSRLAGHRHAAARDLLEVTREERQAVGRMSQEIALEEDLGHVPGAITG